MTDPDIPAGTRSLLRQLEGWSTQVRHATGHCQFNALSEDTNGEGRRHRVSVIEAVDSVLVRARHVDGRALVALWMRRATRKGWTLDLAWRARHSDDLAPQQITARQLTAYVTAPDVRSALVALEAPRRSAA
jgi:hypothetical protein